MSFEFRAQGCMPPLPGTVFGVLLNERGARDALGSAMQAAPYGKPPDAPVLYIKTRNTLVHSGARVALAPDVEAVEVGGVLGIVLARSLGRADTDQARAAIAGYVPVADLCVPHASVYRPAVRQRCRDGFCPVGEFVPASRVADPDGLALDISIDGVLAQRAHTGSMVRSVARLLADISAFLTLAAGDVVLLGVAAGAPLARAGQQFRVQIEGLGCVEGTLALEEAVA